MQRQLKSKKEKGKSTIMTDNFKPEPLNSMSLFSLSCSSSSLPSLSLSPPISPFTRHPSPSLQSISRAFVFISFFFPENQPRQEREGRQFRKDDSKVVVGCKIKFVLMTRNRGSLRGEIIFSGEFRVHWQLFNA